MPRNSARTRKWRYLGYPPCFRDRPQPRYAGNGIAPTSRSWRLGIARDVAWFGETLRIAPSRWMPPLYCITTPGIPSIGRLTSRDRASDLRAPPIFTDRGEYTIPYKSRGAPRWAGRNGWGRTSAASLSCGYKRRAPGCLTYLEPKPYRRYLEVAPTDPPCGIYARLRPPPGKSQTPLRERAASRPPHVSRGGAPSGAIGMMHRRCENTRWAVRFL